MGVSFTETVNAARRGMSRILRGLLYVQMETEWAVAYMSLELRGKVQAEDNLGSHWTGDS